MDDMLAISSYDHPKFLSRFMIIGYFKFKVHIFTNKWRMIRAFFALCVSGGWCKNLHHTLKLSINVLLTLTWQRLPHQPTFTVGLEQATRLL